MPRQPSMGLLMRNESILLFRFMSIGGSVMVSAFLPHNFSPQLFVFKNAVTARSVITKTIRNDIIFFNLFSFHVLTMTKKSRGKYQLFAPTYTIIS